MTDPEGKTYECLGGPLDGESVTLASGVGVHKIPSPSFLLGKKTRGTYAIGQTPSGVMLLWQGWDK